MDIELPKLIAHRAGAGLAPENTLNALVSAKQNGALWVEFDVMQTLDDVPIIFHDETLARIAKVPGKVADKTFAELSALDADIPTLEQYIQKAAELKLGINIELKAPKSKASLLVKQVLSVLTQYWNKTLPTPLISSFPVPNLIALNEANCPYPIGLNVNEWSPECVMLAKKLGCYSIHVNQQYITPSCIKLNNENNLKTLAYTINDTATAQKLFEMGVTAVFSDFPNLLKGINLK
jgi:glycerophosphoryl diester phosphodiesterase